MNSLLYKLNVAANLVEMIGVNATGLKTSVISPLINVINTAVLLQVLMASIMKKDGHVEISYSYRTFYEIGFNIDLCQISLVILV